tara:strand:- start:710 stop:925 length:216 start_codon:yes stop_codon:yes gene_type:complete
MSAEKISNVEINKFPPLEISQKSDKVISGRVDINVLLDRARKVKTKENKTNLVFLGLTLCLIFMAGIILSF